VGCLMEMALKKVVFFKAVTKYFPRRTNETTKWTDIRYSGRDTSQTLPKRVVICMYVCILEIVTLFL
jgi:hypothetical protein